MTPGAAEGAVLFSFRENNFAINNGGIPDIMSASPPNTLRTGLVAQNQVNSDGPGGFPEIFIGPEVGIARGLYNPIHSPHIAIIKVAYGGTRISSWQKGNSSGFFNIMKGRVAAAIGELQTRGFPDVKVDGFFWQQGESDSNTTANGNAYQGQLQSLISDFRAEIGNPETKIVLGGILEVPALPNAGLVNAGMRAVADADPNIIWFSTNDLSVTSFNTFHFNFAGELEMGLRFASNFQQLNAPEPGALSIVTIGIILIGLRNRHRFVVAQQPWEKLPE